MQVGILKEGDKVEFTQEALNTLGNVVDGGVHTVKFIEYRQGCEIAHFDTHAPANSLWLKISSK